MKKLCVTCFTKEDFKQAIKDGHIPEVGSGTWFVESDHEIITYGSAQIFAGANVAVSAQGESTVYASGEAKVEAHEFSTVYANSHGTVVAFGFSRVVASGSVNVTAFNSATVVAGGKSKVTAKERSVVRVISPGVTVRASGWATIILETEGATIEATPTVTVINRVIKSTSDWAAAQSVTEREGKFVLYKWADKNGHTQQGVYYKEGEYVEAPDWDQRPESGGGLHACASLEDSKEFRSSLYTHAVELLVDPADCRPPKTIDACPRKIKFKRAFVTRVWDPEEDHTPESVKEL